MDTAIKGQHNMKNLISEEESYIDIVCKAIELIKKNKDKFGKQNVLCAVKYLATEYQVMVMFGASVK